MIRFKRKQYTIQEGHYTGPKDVEELPGLLESIGKGTAGGAVVGGVVGKLKENVGILKGAMTGGKFGFLGGIAYKILVNSLHNPMKSVKYQEVDRMIRKDFGIYQMAGVTIGDSSANRSRLEDRFGFSDRDVTSYKINFVIHNDRVTLYTFGMTDQELNKTSDILDYYCKKYQGMEYTSSLINPKMNAYAVIITFTNYHILSNFILEISEKIGKVNVLDNKPLVDRRLKEESIEGPDLGRGEIKFRDSLFSDTPRWSQILGKAKSGMGAGLEYLKTGGKYTIEVLKELVAMNFKESGNNTWLINFLKKNHYTTGLDFTQQPRNSKRDAFTEVTLFPSWFIVTCPKSSPDIESLDKWAKRWMDVKTDECGALKVYRYQRKGDKELGSVVKSLMTFGVVPNIY